MDAAAAERFHDWAILVAPWSRSASIDEARRALAGQWEYVGKVVESAAGDLPGAFPSRLWEYEYNYRRWLEGIAHSDGRDQVMAWLRRAESAATGAARAPYVIARRLWSEAIAAGLLDINEMLERIARDVELLSSMPELHLLANHLLADRASVAAMRMLLAQHDPASFRAVGKYLDELRRQFDADGVHEERSPSYHLIALHDLRRTRAAAGIAGLAEVEKELGEIEERAGKALALLLHPDGTLPMFHDSTALVSPSARDLGVGSAADGGYDLRKSGYCGWRGDVDGAAFHLIADYGAPRPEHQPGHQHAAPFAFELFWGGAWIGGAGVTTYDRGERRELERSAAAHASVRVDGCDPAELWAAFRMGQGYRVMERNVAYGAESADRQGCRSDLPPGWRRSMGDGSEGLFVCGRHDGFRAIRHHRALQWSVRESAIEVVDTIDGAGSATVELFFPLAAAVMASRSESAIMLEAYGRRVSLHATCSAAVPGRLDSASDLSDVTIDSFNVARQFGKPERSQRLAITITGMLPIESRVVIGLQR